MIKAITVINSHREKARFELSNPSLNGILVTNIEGLGPPKANINMLKVSTFDGSIFNSSKIEERNLVITFRPLPSSDVESKRLFLYKMLPIKSYVTVVVETDNRIGGISGYIESNEPDIFSSGETIQVSILCPDPYFKQYEGLVEKKTILTPNEPKPTFEFPFDNNSLDIPLLEMGSASPSGDAAVKYEGDSVTYPIFKFNFTENIDTTDKFLLIEKMVPYMSTVTQRFALDLSKYKGTISAGDSIEIDFRPGHKSVQIEKHLGSLTIYKDIYSAVPFRVTIGGATFDNEWLTVEYGESSFNSQIVEPSTNTNIWGDWTDTTAEDGVSIFADTPHEELPLYIRFDIEFRPTDESEDCWAMFISNNTDPSDPSLEKYTYSKITDCLNLKMNELYSGSDAISEYDYKGNITYKFSPRTLEGITIHVETNTNQSTLIGQIGSSIGIKKLGTGSYQYRVRNVQVSLTPFGNSLKNRVERLEGRGLTVINGKLCMRYIQSIIEHHEYLPFTLDISYNVLYGGM